jgi:dienelactone hydrolase
VRALALAIWMGSAAVSESAEVHFPGASSSGVAELRGPLFRPEETGPVPAMVLLHHCGGLTANVTVWGERLRAEGYVALAVNSFGVRRARDCTSLGTLDNAVRALAADGVAALAYLKGLPFVDPERVGVMGWSLGAMATLRLVATAGPPDRQFRAGVAFYPSCDPYLSGTTIPVLLLLGGADTLTVAPTCIGRARALQQQGRPITLQVYAGAKHGFDMAELTLPGRAITNLAYDPAVDAQSRVHVSEFLRAELRGPKP